MPESSELSGDAMVGQVESGVKNAVVGVIPEIIGRFLATIGGVGALRLFLQGLKWLKKYSACLLNVANRIVEGARWLREFKADRLSGVIRTMLAESVELFASVLATWAGA